jgi:hypothetical protein
MRARFSTSFGCGNRAHVRPSAYSTPELEVRTDLPFVVASSSTTFGGQLMYLVSGSLHVGGELRIIVANDSAVVFAGNVGMVF